MAKTKMSLAETHPEVAKQWHPTKNDDLTPSDVTYGSDKIIWWKCSKGNDHEWEARIANRTTLKRGCPICGGKKIVTSNSLFTTHPKLLKIWHYQKNKDLDPKEISKGSNKKVWWKCPKGNNHEWEAPPYRVNENSCPYCNGIIPIKFHQRKCFQILTRKCGGNVLKVRIMNGGHQYLLEQKGIIALFVQDIELLIVIVWLL
jgi:hypothetical protein